MFNVGGMELLVIAVLALVVLGPEKLPGAIRQVGQVLGELRKVSSGFQTDLRQAIDQAEREAGEQRSADPSGTGAGADAGASEPDTAAGARAAQAELAELTAAGPTTSEEPDRSGDPVDPTDPPERRDGSPTVADPRSSDT